MFQTPLDYIATFLLILLPFLFIIAVCALVMAITVACGVLISWNEKKILKEEELPMEERLKIAFSKPLEMKEEYSEWDKQFVREYNERNGLS